MNQNLIYAEIKHVSGASNIIADITLSRIEMVTQWWI